MNIVKIINRLSIFATMPPCFTCSELIDVIGSNVDQKLLRVALLKEPRLICVHSGSPEEDRFILDSTLFRFFSSLNMRIAQLGLFRLTESQINSKMNNLRWHGKWDSPPTEIIRWGQSLGLICNCRTSGEYVFPLAWILSLLKPYKLASNILMNLCENRFWALSQEKWVENPIEEGLYLFKPKVIFTIKGRIGLITGKKMTLEEIGAVLKYTREFVRQLENKFWKSLRYQKYRSPFIKALLCDIIMHSGSLIIPAKSPKAHLRSFLASCNSIPQVSLSKIGLLITGASSKDIAPLKSTNWSLKEIDPEFIADRLESDDQIPLNDSDVQEIAKRVARFRNKRLTVTQRAYIALRTIGRPAHYSEITDVYNSLWPNSDASEHHVHSALSRQEYSVVWIGIHGTYALKEWGYEYPSIKLFEAVVKIVEEKFLETGKPVPFIVIRAEIGKYRRVVKESSVIMSAHFNPRLRLIGKDSFVPRDYSENAQNDYPLDKLDKIFRDFQQTT